MKKKSNTWLLSKMAKVAISNPINSIGMLKVSNLKKLAKAMKVEPPEQIIHNFMAYLSNKSPEISRADALGADKIKELEANYPGITSPVGISNAYALEDKFNIVPSIIDDAAPHRINVILPQLDPLIMFGGYISCLQFIAALVEKRFLVRILISESLDFDKAKMLEKLSHNAFLCDALAVCEYENITAKDSDLVISANDSFIAYSFWTGIIAHDLASKIGQKFIFFIQEYEPIFHPQDSFHAIGEFVYSLPHKAIFNTVILRDYFKYSRLGVFEESEKEGLEASCFYQHALTKTAPPIISELQLRKKKRMIFYGRPENHAKRNLFEIALMGLKTAVFDGVFDQDEWEFIGIGTLGTEHVIELGHGHKLNLISKMSQSDYAEALRGFDVGISLMYAPHPSILPFEMASSGIVTVTNTYGSRDKKLLKSISENIVPCKPNHQSVAEAIAEAVERSYQYEQRVTHSDIDWVSDWQDSFNSDVMNEITNLIRKD